MMANISMLIGFLWCLSHIICDAASPNDHQGATNDDIMELVKRLVGQMHNMDARMHNLENQGDRMESKIHKIESQGDRMESRMQIMEQQTADMMNELAKQIKVEDKKIRKNSQTLEKISVIVKEDLQTMSKDVREIKEVLTGGN